MRDDDGIDRIVDLGERLEGVADLSELLSQQRLDEARAEATACGRARPARRCRCRHHVQRTLPHPGKIFCIGVNYGGRNAEYQDGQEAPTNPSVFVRFPGSLVGHGSRSGATAGERATRLRGRDRRRDRQAGRRIPEDRAREHIAGLTLGNEGTIRDWVRHAKFNVTQGKNWESSGSIGPWMVTLDEIGDFDDLHLTTRVNGELRQDDTPASMAYPIEFQVAYLSTFCTLEPGDVIFTGTPSVPAPGSTRRDSSGPVTSSRSTCPRSARSPTGYEMSEIDEMRATIDVAAADCVGIRGFDRSLPMALMRAREAVMRHFRPSLAEHDLTEQQWRVLRALEDAGSALSVGELANRTFLLGPSLSRMLVSLDDRGLIARTSVLGDARRVEITITAIGLELVAEIAPRSESAYDHIERRLGADELEQLYALLDKVAPSDDR